MYGRLIYVYGAMGSAKTAELLIEAYEHEEKGFGAVGRDHALSDVQTGE